jgi:pimeloyl-ACP methyl ester carboxylesterase
MRGLAKQNILMEVLPGVGHMIQYAAPDLVIAEIEARARDQ